MELTIEKNIKNNMNDLFLDLRELEELNSDLLAMVIFKGKFIKIKIKSKSDPTCWCELPVMLIDNNAWYAQKEIYAMRDIVDILCYLNRFYGVRKAVLGKLAKL